MGIQPIDLQTMYSQLSNVAKTMSGAQQAQLTESMQQQGNIQRELENSQKVQQTSNEKANANKINQNGSGSQTFAGHQGKKEKKDEDSENQNENQSYYRNNNPPYLGSIIDISR